MKKLTVLFLLSSSLAFGQRNFTIEETVFGARQFAPKNIVAPQWIPNRDAFTHLDDQYQRLLIRDAKANWAEQELINIHDLTTAIKNAVGNKEIVRLGYFPYEYTWKDEQHLDFSFQGKEKNYALRYNTADKKVTVIAKTPSTGKNVETSPDFSKTAYLIGNNIHIVDSNGQDSQLTQDTTDGIVNGSDYTHRQEFGITKGMWWSPDNTQLLYYRKDETMVAKYPLIQWDERIASAKEIRYPMAGEKSEEVTLVVYDTKTNNKVTLQTGEPKEQFLTICTWDPSSKFIYVGVLNREQNHLKLNKYDAQNGQLVKTLFEEQSTTWVEPLHALIFLPNDPEKFLYQTDNEGYNQLYLYNTNGKLLKKLGYQDVIVEKTLNFDKAGKQLTYVGITNKGLDRQLFQVNVNNGKTQQLTQSSGNHSASSLNSNGTYVLDQFSDINTPNNITVNTSKGKTAATIVKAENPFEGKINLPKIEAVSLTSADGKTPLNGRIIYPSNFDPTKKYPVMYYLYGGSHAQLVQNDWLYGAGYFDLYMAQQGYIVFTMDNRGSDARGRDFTRITHRHLGQAEMDDQLKGVAFLKSKSFVDQDRLGIFGWSFGGFMTTSFMVQHPGVFQTAVAGGPVIDWKYYEVMYGERYMDMPQENPEGYAQTSLLDKASNLKGNLLIIHGAQDPVVVQQNSMEFIEACIKAGKQVDYFLYPTHEHNVMGKDRIHMYDKIAKYFDMHLKK